MKETKPNLDLFHISMKGQLCYSGSWNSASYKLPKIKIMKKEVCVGTHIQGFKYWFWRMYPSIYEYIDWYFTNISEDFMYFTDISMNI